MIRSGEATRSNWVRWMDRVSNGMVLWWTRTLHCTALLYYIANLIIPNIIPKHPRNGRKSEQEEEEGDGGRAQSIFQSYYNIILLFASNLGRRTMCCIKGRRRRGEDGTEPLFHRILSSCTYISYSVAVENEDYYVYYAYP